MSQYFGEGFCVWFDHSFLLIFRTLSKNLRFSLSLRRRRSILGRKQDYGKREDNYVEMFSRKDTLLKACQQECVTRRS